MRTILSSVFLDITQGKGQTLDVERCDLRISEDNISFGNAVGVALATTANRRQQLRWYMTMANDRFTFIFSLIIKTDLSIRKGYALFQ